MSRGERDAQQPTGAETAAEQEAARPAGVRRGGIVVGGSILVVLAVVVGLIVAKSMSKPPVAAAATTESGIVAEITSLPAAAFTSAGTSAAAALTTTTSQSELTLNGKPELLYLGAEYCPYCAAERWAVTAALSRFGTFSGLSFIHSAPDDGDIATLSFYKSRYTSKYLSFVPVEWFSETVDPKSPTGYAVLQTPTLQELALFSKYDAAPYTSDAGALPFIDIGNQYLSLSSQYPPEPLLSGLSWSQIGADMQNPSNQVGKSIDGAANLITAAVCRLTHGRPGNVCTSAAVTAASRSG